MHSPKFGRELNGRKLRLFFADGEVSVAVIVSAEAHDDCEGCDGFVYDLLSTETPARREATDSRAVSALWTRFEDLVKYEILAE